MSRRSRGPPARADRKGKRGTSAHRFVWDAGTVPRHVQARWAGVPLRDVPVDWASGQFKAIVVQRFDRAAAL